MRAVRREDRTGGQPSLIPSTRAFHTILFYDNILQDICGREPGIGPHGKEDGNMTCKTFSGMISSFLSGTLEDDSLREFLEHYDKCENCREEVEIQYLVSRAFDHRKEKEVINLSRDLPALVEKERSSMVFRSRLGYTAYTLEILTVILVILTAFIFLR